MTDKWLLLVITALFIGGGVNEAIQGNYGKATFDFTFGIGVGVYLIGQSRKEWR